MVFEVPSTTKSTPATAFSRVTGTVTSTVPATTPSSPSPSPSSIRLRPTVRVFSSVKYDAKLENASRSTAAMCRLVSCSSERNSSNSNLFEPSPLGTNRSPSSTRVDRGTGPSSGSSTVSVHPAVSVTRSVLLSCTDSVPPSTTADDPSSRTGSSNFETAGSVTGRRTACTSVSGREGVNIQCAPPPTIDAISACSSGENRCHNAKSSRNDSSMAKLASTGTISAFGTDTRRSVSASGATSVCWSPAATTSRTDWRSGHSPTTGTPTSEPSVGKPKRTPPMAGSDR